MRSRKPSPASCRLLSLLLAAALLLALLPAGGGHGLLVSGAPLPHLAVTAATGGDAEGKPQEPIGLLCPAVGPVATPLLHRPARRLVVAGSSLAVPARPRPAAPLPRPPPRA